LGFDINQTVPAAFRKLIILLDEVKDANTWGDAEKMTPEQFSMYQEVMKGQA